MSVPPLQAILTELSGPKRSLQIAAVADRLVSELDPDQDQILELVAVLAGPDKAMRRAAGNLLAAIADRAPAVLVDHVSDLIEVSRTQTGPAAWASTQALAAIASHEPDVLAPYVSDVAAAINGTSVIARDNAVRILGALASLPTERAEAMSMLLQMLESAPVNQLPTYAELVGSIAGPEADRIRGILTRRMTENLPPAKMRRLNAVLKRLPD